jgi:K+-sensing histidine kinase KdpD
MNDRTKLDATLAGPLAGFTALLAGLLLGGVLVPVQETVGLANIAMIYMAIVCVAAAVGGGLGGVIAGVSAALCYNFFFTPPHMLLRITVVDQLVTIVLLLAAGPVTSVAANFARGELRDALRDDARQAVAVPHRGRAGRP